MMQFPTPPPPIMSFPPQPIPFQHSSQGRNDERGEESSSNEEQPYHGKHFPINPDILANGNVHSKESLPIGSEGISHPEALLDRETHGSLVSLRGKFVYSLI